MFRKFLALLLIGLLPFQASYALAMGGCVHVTGHAASAASSTPAMAEGGQSLQGEVALVGSQAAALVQAVVGDAAGHASDDVPAACDACEAASSMLGGHVVRQDVSSPTRNFQLTNGLLPAPDPIERLDHVPLTVPPSVV
ncbi:MAG: hypothetical protein LH480_14350 [Rubrivivax sp.]|nr:hypothetical protein [Rubrivivax sp.]